MDKTKTRVVESCVNNINTIRFYFFREKEYPLFHKIHFALETRNCVLLGLLCLYLQKLVECVFAEEKFKDAKNLYSWDTLDWCRFKNLHYKANFYKYRVENIVDTIHKQNL